MIEKLKGKVLNKTEDVRNKAVEWWHRNGGAVIVGTVGLVGLAAAAGIGYLTGHVSGLSEGIAEGYAAGLSDEAKAAYALTKAASPEIAERVFGDPSTWVEFKF